jgi:hypothetical protein
VILRTAGENPAQVVWQKQYAWNEAVTTEITLPGIAVKNDEKYNFKIIAKPTSTGRPLPGSPTWSTRQPKTQAWT